MLHNRWIVQYEWALYMDSEKLFTLYTGSWTYYVWINPHLQIEDSTIQVAFAKFN